MKQTNYKLTLLKTGYLLLIFFAFTFSFFYDGGLEGFKKGWAEADGDKLTELPYIKLEPLKKDTIKLASANNSDSIFFTPAYLTTAYIKGDSLSKKIKLYTFLQSIPILTIGVLGILLFIKMYKFINAIASKEVFTLINIKRLSSMGWICIVITALNLLYEYISYKSKTRIVEDQPYKVIPNFGIDFSWAIFGITLLTIAFAFKKGLELQQENELTV